MLTEQSRLRGFANGSDHAAVGGGGGDGSGEAGEFELPHVDPEVEVVPCAQPAGGEDGSADSGSGGGGSGGGGGGGDSSAPAVDRKEWARQMLKQSGDLVLICDILGIEGTTAEKAERLAGRLGL
jgi:hypothetical protein